MDRFNFKLTQLQSFRSVLENIITFTPDGKTADDFQDLIDASLLIQTNAQDAKSNLDLARGTRIAAVDEGHDLCVMIYKQLGSIYRKDTSSRSAIDKLPVKDQTPQETLDRMDAISSLWSKLPNPPGSATPFSAKIEATTMNHTAFAAKVTALRNAMAAEVDAEEDYEEKQGKLRAQEEVMADLVTAAFEQGRGQFPLGTAEREQIDAVPQEPDTPFPGKATISNVVFTAARAITFDVAANHGTRFDIFQKAPGASDFVMVSGNFAEETYATTLSVGDGVYQFKALPKNSTGDGEESDVVSVTSPGTP